MTTEPSTSKAIEFGLLSELAQYHRSVLFSNINKRTSNESHPPPKIKKRPTKKLPAVNDKKGRRSMVMARPSPSLPPGLDPEPPHSELQPKTRTPKIKTRSTYSFNRQKLPGLVSRAKELMKKWDKEKVMKNKHAEEKAYYIQRCNQSTINHLKCNVDRLKPTNPVYILMEFRKSLIRHDWAGVKKLLKVFLRSSNLFDCLTWKILVATLFYYPGAEPALLELIEQNRQTFPAQEVLEGLLTIGGMEKFDDRHERNVKSKTWGARPKETRASMNRLHNPPNEEED